MPAASAQDPCPCFEIIEHPADIGFVAYGATLKELFANAATALLTLACDPATLEEREQRTIVATGSDLESLLFAWLAEILAVSDAEKLFFRRAQVDSLSEDTVRGIVFGERFDRTRHRAGTYIKAVTYHQLRVERVASPGAGATRRWRAQVYLDV